MNNQSKKTGLRGTESQAKARVLLTLWDMGADKAEVKKGDLTERIKRTNETAQDYKNVIEQLQEEGAIASATKNRVTNITLEKKGLQLLDQALKGSEFQFDSQIGARTANALLRWLREMGTLSNGATAPAAGGKKVKAIASYDEFKSEAFPLFEKLNKSYNYGGLVPIWHLRRELGERISREEFNDWMMQMQAEQLFYLQSGEARGATQEQKQDSITDEVRGLLFFASQP